MVSSDLNMPIAGLAAAVTALTVDLPTPPGSLRTKLARLDWM
jgi:hypothetical protein